MLLNRISQHKYEKENKYFLFAVVAPWNFQTQQKQRWICPFKRKQKDPPKTWNSCLIYFTACIYLNQSFVYDLVVLAVKIT